MKKLIAALLLPLSVTAQATVVEVQTNKGTIEINLYDETTPETVANFLAYVNNGSYNGAIYHRLVPGFVLQGGGYVYNGSSTLNTIETAPPVINEPVHSNVRGTVAMAKIGSSENSATVQWFFNLEDNASRLDAQNGGFTVFGQVTQGMDIVDSIGALPTFNFGGALAELPLDNYSDEDYNGDPDNNIDPLTPDSTHFVIIENVTITDTAVDSAAALDKPENTLIDDVDELSDFSDTKSGALGVLALFGLLGLRRRR
ncbi:MAG: peptidylprolyl isomerase [Gammaproteobacteria bacterium]|nr:peptidylprolyl isomerase [Gammaproteobacteria bacterium]